MCEKFEAEVQGQILPLIEVFCDTFTCERSHLPSLLYHKKDFKDCINLSKKSFKFKRINGRKFMSGIFASSYNGL